MNNFSQSLFDGVSCKRDTRPQLKPGEACIYRKSKNFRFSISNADAQELRKYTRLNIERNTYTGELYMIFNNNTGWDIFTTNTGQNIISNQASLYNVLAKALGVAEDYEGHTRFNIKRSLIENVYIIKK